MVLKMITKKILLELEISTQKVQIYALKKKKKKKKKNLLLISST